MSSAHRRQIFNGGSRVVRDRPGAATPGFGGRDPAGVAGSPWPFSRLDARRRRSFCRVVPMQAGFLPGLRR